MVIPIVKAVFCILFFFTISVKSFELKKFLHQKIHPSVKENANLLVKIEDGNIRGREDRTVGSNTIYYAFQGIPFAQPPLGNLRFKPPVPNSKWKDILNATQDKSECTQGQNPVTGSEDCLYINVYTPVSVLQKKLPVMVWIYGGIFISGNSSYGQFGPDYFLDQDVVFVSFNYRLGIFGFLSTDDLSSPGNNGLRDQVLALKWVQKNIAQFGGDPKKVTIFGQSAGSASISYLQQSEQSKGLFQAAIQQSGSSLCLWALGRKSRKIAFYIGEYLKINTTKSQVLVDGLRNINFATLQDAASSVSNAVMFEDPRNGLGFSPVIEPVHEGAFFSAKSHQLLSTGKFPRVPTIIGFNSNEAAAAGSGIVVNLIVSLYSEKFLYNASLLVPGDMNVNESQTALVGRDIKSHYFSSYSIPALLQINSVIEVVSDDQFVRPIRENVRLQSQFAPVYFYKLSYVGGLGGVGDRQFSGVGHSEDLGYLFRTYNSSASPNDKLIRSRMVKFWTNFAKFSNPTPNEDVLFENNIWPNAGLVRNNLLYIDIDTSLNIQINPNDKNVKYWNQLYNEFGNPPYDTY